MEASNISLLCRSGELTLEIRVNDVPTYGKFIEKLQKNMPWIDNEIHSFTYELNIDQKTSLNCENDFKNMILLGSLLKRSVIYVGLPANPSLQVTLERRTEKSTILDYYPQRKKVAPQPKKPVSRKRKGTTVPSFVFEEPSYPKAYVLNEFEEENEPTQLSSRERAREKEATGEWYPGCQTHIPYWDIAPEEEEVVLLSAKWCEYITHVGQEFYGGMVEFRNKLIKYSAKLGFCYVYTKNDARYIRVECEQREEEGCQWFVKGTESLITKHLVIKAANLKHTCKLSMMTCDTKRMGQRLVDGFITDAIRATPILTPTDLKRDILKYWGFNISYEKVWRAVEVARANLFGTYDDSFDELRWYSDAVKRTNSGSVVVLETEPTENRFKRYFMAFDASLKGFKHCRPMLFVDGTLMNTRYKGTLLSATAKDGNNGLFPVAIAVVDSENTDNWTWFIDQIMKHVKHDKEIMYVSDHAGGLLNAFRAMPNKPLHYFCLFHLMKNLRAMYHGKKYSDVFKNHMCKLLKDAAFAPTMAHFNCAIAIFKQKGGPPAVHFLQDLPPEKWAVAFSPQVHRYGELTSNAVESFNNWILDARSLPVTFMLDCILMQVMRWFNERRSAIAKATGALTPRLGEHWNKESQIGQNWSIVPGPRHGIVQVLSTTSPMWQLRDFPCVHAIAVINESRWDIRSVVEPYFFVDTYKVTYMCDINPIPRTDKFEFIDLNHPAKILPPVHRSVPGRPKQKRFKSKGETKIKVNRFLCGRCGKHGSHYWTTCADALD